MTCAIRAGDPVTVSIAAANRDPVVFGDPDRFDIRRALLDRLPGLRLDPERPSAPRGLVFRKPPALHVRWD